MNTKLVSRGIIISATILLGGLFMSATILLGGLFMGQNTLNRSVNANAACASHCYADREETYEDHRVHVLSADFHKPDPEIDDTAAADASTVSMWITDAGSTCWLEAGIVKGDGTAYPITPTLYAFCKGCTDGRWSNLGDPGGSNLIRMKYYAGSTNVDYDIWKWQTCPGGGCTHGSDSGWVDRRTSMFNAHCDLKRVIAGGEAFNSSLSVMGIAGIHNLTRTLSASCGGVSQPACEAAWVPTQSAYLVKTIISGTPRYGTFFYNNILQVISICHIDGNGCPPSS